MLAAEVAQHANRDPKLSRCTTAREVRPSRDATRANALFSLETQQRVSHNGKVHPWCEACRDNNSVWGAMARRTGIPVIFVSLFFSISTHFIQSQSPCCSLREDTHRAHRGWKHFAAPLALPLLALDLRITSAA